MNNQRQFLLGIFFLITLSILPVYTLFLTNIDLFGKQITETVYFPDAFGLKEGDPVQVSGLQVGHVKDLDFDPNAEHSKRIKAILSLDREIELMRGAKITIQESTLLGGRHVDIDPGEFGGPPLDLCRQLAPFHSQVSDIGRPFVPPNITTRLRRESYAIACSSRRSDVE